MISEKAKQEFLNRKLNNFDWMKKLSSKVLDKEIASLLPEKFKWGKVQLYLHQKVVFLIIINLQRFLVFLDMGGGKTILTLMTIKYRKARGENPRVLVLVPYVSAVNTWIEETAKHAPQLTCVPLLESGAKNLETVKHAEGDLFVGCYQSVLALASKREKKGGWELAADDVKKIFKDFDMLVLDEIHKVKNVSSMTYRMCRAIAKQVDWCLGLTGTPFGRDPMDLWAQFYLVDFGETLGNTLGFYREIFFTQSQNFWGGFVYKFRKRMLPKLTEVIKNNSIRYEISECHDMPKKTYIPKYVSPTEAIRNYYNNAVDEFDSLNRRKTDNRKLKNTFIQICQLASGFLTLKEDDESGSSTNKYIDFDENPKMDALIDLVDSMPYGCKMVVFQTYVHTNELICKTLKQLKIGHATVYGKQTKKKQLAELHKFKTNEDCHVLVINSQSGSTSQNLQIANYVVFFEQPGATDKQQAERRVWRPGQDKRVFIYDLIMKGTNDEKLVQYNKEGKDLLKSVLDGKESIGKLK